MEAFRFYDLPLEIRNIIYQKILYAHHEHREPEDMFPVLSERRMYKIKHTIEPQILRASKQTFKEGKIAMVRANLFVKFVTNVFDMQRIFHVLCIPFLVEGVAAEKFEGHVLYSELWADSSLASNKFELILPRQDLGLLCDAIGQATWAVPQFKDDVQLSVTLVNPFDKDITSIESNFLSMKIKESLLAPYRKHLKGLKRFEVEGGFPGKLKRAAIADVKRNPHNTPADIMKFLRTQKEIGVEHFRQGNLDGAGEAWTNACQQILTVAPDAARAELQRSRGSEFADQVTEIYFLLCSNLVANCVAIMRKNIFNRQLVQDYGACASKNMGEAMYALSMFGSTWQPSPQHMAKLGYRGAVASRIAGNPDNIEVAIIAISMAHQTLPADPDIAKEYGAIVKWARSYGKDID